MGLQAGKQHVGEGGMQVLFAGHPILTSISDSAKLSVRAAVLIKHISRLPLDQGAGAI